MKPASIVLIILLLCGFAHSGASGGRAWEYTECAESERVNFIFDMDSQDFGNVGEFSIKPVSGTTFASCGMISCSEAVCRCSYYVCRHSNTSRFVLNANGTLLNFNIPEEDALRGGEFSLKLYKDRVEVTKQAGSQFWLYTTALVALAALVAYIAGRLLRR